MKRIQTQTLLRLAMLLALEVILSRFLSISTPLVKIGLAFIPIAICAMLYGPLWAGVLGALGDFLGATLFPIGPFFPGFTLSAFLTGLVFGLCLSKRRGWGRILLAAAINCMGISLFLGALWLHMLGGTPYVTLLPLRFLQSCILFPIQSVVLYLLSRQSAFSSAARPG